MKTNRFPKQFVRNFYLLFLVVSLIGLVNFGIEQVQASKTEASTQVRQPTVGLPTCSFGYGQCRKGCQNAPELVAWAKAAPTMDEGCMKECNFLYGGCRESFAFPW